MKSYILRRGADVRVDDRGIDLHSLLGCPPQFLLSYLYPRMYNIAAISVHATIGTEVEDVGAVVMPQQEQLCAERVNSAGIYFLDDIQHGMAIMWIGEKVSTKALNLVFGLQVETFDNVTDQSLTAPEASEKVRNVLAQMRKWNCISAPRVQVVREKRDTLEAMFWQRMVEDKNCGESQSYIDYLCKLHSAIREKMNN